MPVQLRSVRLTDLYRDRQLAARRRLEQQAARLWPSIGELDSSDWVDRMAAGVAAAQTQAVRVTAGYLSAFLSSELGERVRGPDIPSRLYAGKSRDGRNLRESLRSPLIGVLGALKAGDTPEKALSFGLTRATRMVGLDFDHAHRSALLNAIESDDRFDGWRRVTTGTCGACAAKAGVLEHGVRFQIHPGCGCVSQPNVKGAPDRFPVPTGAEIFASKTSEERDEMLGPEAAALVAAGVVTLDELVDESPLEEGEAFITQRPIQSVVS